MKINVINNIEFLSWCIEKSTLKILSLNNDWRILKEKYWYYWLDDKLGIVYGWWDEG